MLTIQQIIGITVLLIILFSLYAYVVQAVNYLRTLQNKQIELGVYEPMHYVFERSGIADCLNTKLPCITDRQCENNCARQTALGSLTCDEGFCSVRDARISGQPIDFFCDPALGLMSVYVASEFVVDQMCISLYRDIFNDLGETRPYICQPGVLTTDLANKQFSHNDCVCATGYTKMLFDQTALARTIPVCIPNAAVNVYKHIYQIA